MTVQAPPPVAATGGLAARGGHGIPAGDRRARWWRRLTPWLFLSPFLLLFFVFVVLPLLWALNLSTYRTKLVGGRTFVGIDNYLKVLTDSTLWDGVRNVLSFGLFQVPVMLGLALVAALILDGGLVRRQTIYRLFLFLPFAVPGVVAALIWGYLYGQAFGPVAQVARFLDLQPPQFLTQATILPLLANISTWQYTGYNMLILFAALKAVPTELYEAARVDGATDVQIAWRIKIPLIFPALVLATIFSIIGTLQLFTEPRLLRTTAPTVIGPAFTPNLYVESLAFQNRQFDYAAAVSFSIAILTAVLSGFVLYLVYRRSRV
jgi:multiple sugar transport system permease protein